MITTVFQFFGALVVLMSFSPKLIIFEIILIPLVIVVRRWMRRGHNVRWKAWRKRETKMHDHLNEVFVNINTVKTMSTEDLEYKTYCKYLKEVAVDKHSEWV